MYTVGGCSHLQSVMEERSLDEEHLEVSEPREVCYLLADYPNRFIHSNRQEMSGCPQERNEIDLYIALIAPSMASTRTLSS